MAANHSKGKKHYAIKFIFAAVIFVAVLIFSAFAYTIYNSREVIARHIFLTEETQINADIPEDTPVITQEPTEKPSPTPRPAFIPDPDDLLPLPSFSEIQIDENSIIGEIEDEAVNISWEIVNDADYYVLYAINDDNAVYHTEILWSNISKWLIPEVKNGNIYLFSYEDMGEDSAEDDELISVYSMSVEKEVPEVQATPKPVQTASNTEKPTKVKNKYMLILDKSDFTFAAFTYDENGDYTILVKAFPTAIGKSSRMTPNGTFEISSKGEWKDWGSGWFSPFYTRYTSGLYIHGSLYSSRKNSSMMVQYYEEIGTMATSGCLRTTFEGAKWVYYNCPAGTLIKITESSDLVSKVEKTPLDEEFPYWDPTDPDKPQVDPPSVYINNVLRLEQGETMPLAGLLLSTDARFNDNTLLYKVVAEPTSGTLSHTEFTQAELADGIVEYTHDGSLDDTDNFQFTVSNEKTTTVTTAFIIKINIEEGAEEIIPDNPPAIETNEWITINQGESIALTSYLIASDDLASNEELVYTVTAPPNHGSIELSFTQADILAGSVIYVHSGDTSTSDSFMFSLTDGVNVVESQMFTISINAPETTPETTPEPSDEPET